MALNIPTVEFSSPVLQETERWGTQVWHFEADQPLTLSGINKYFYAKLLLPEIDGKRRKARIVFSPETRTGFGGGYKLTHGVVTADRKNPDGRWMLSLVSECDPATGDLTVTGMRARFSSR